MNTSAGTTGSSYAGSEPERDLIIKSGIHEAEFDACASISGAVLGSRIVHRALFLTFPPLRIIGAIALLLFGMAASSSTRSAGGEAPPAKPPDGKGQPNQQPASKGPDPKEDEEIEREFLRGASLETDHEIDTLLKRAREAVESAKYDQACRFLQKVLDAPGSALTTNDGRVYRSARREAERIIAKMPPAGLEFYRLTADPEAKALLSEAWEKRDIGGLLSVVGRLFMSSHGDEAADMLASLLMDRGEFGAARRLLERVLKEHPTPDVPASILHAKMALCLAREGNGPAAAEHIERALAAGGVSVPGGTAAAKRGPGHVQSLDPAAVAAIRQEIERAGKPRQTSTASGWPMPFGSPGRAAAGPEIPEDTRSGGWVLLWDHPFGLKPPANPPPSAEGTTVFVSSPQGPPLTKAMIMGRWVRNGWIPSRELAWLPGRVFLKTHAAVECLDAATGRLVWKAEESARGGQAGTGMYSHVLVGGVNPDAASKKPAAPEEKTAFADRISAGISIAFGNVYAIERHGDANMAVGRAGMQVVVGGAVRTADSGLSIRGNSLAAWDARTGKFRWRRGRTADENDRLRAVRFVGLPVPCGEKLLVPAEINNELYLAAFDPRDGSLVWQCFLAAYTAQDAPPMEPVYVSAEGNEAYCSTGKGVVLAVDGEMGKVLWAARYARSMPAADARTAWLRQQELCMGWQRGAPVIAGDIAAFAPSDADTIMGLDRTDGKLRWEARRDGCDYLVGAWADRLYCGGPGRVAAYCLRTGKILWIRDIPGVTGLAALTPSALWVPAGGRLAGLRLEDGGAAGEITVQAPDGEPIGNVLFDGERLLAAGPSRVFALIHLDKALAEANRRIGSRPDDLQSLLDRGLLLLAGGRHEESIRDFESVLAKAPGGNEQMRRPAMSALRRALLASSASVKGDAAFALLDRALAVSATPEEKGEVRQAMIEARLKAGDATSAWELARKTGEEVGWDLMDAGNGWKVAGLAWAEEAGRKIAAALPADVRAGIEAKGRKALEEAGKPF